MQQLLQSDGYSFTLFLFPLKKLDVTMPRVIHYKYLEKHLPSIFEKIDLDFNDYGGIIRAHGDKTYTFRYIWEKAGIPFEHGSAIYLLTYVPPYNKESRDTKTGWVDPEIWVIENYSSGHHFKNILPIVDEKDPDILSPF